MITNDNIWERPRARVGGMACLVLDPGETTGYVGGIFPNSALLRMGPDEWMKRIAGDPVGDETGLYHRWVYLRDWQKDGNPVIGRRQCLWLRRGQIFAPDYAPGASYLEQEKQACRQVFRVMSELAIDARKLSQGSLDGVSNLVMEDFVLREHTADRTLLSPVRMITGLYNWVGSSGRFAVDFHLTQVSSAKNLVPDKEIDRLGLYVKGQRHANDACRHLILHVRAYYNSLDQRERKHRFD